MNQDTKTFLLAFAGGLAALFAFTYGMAYISKLSSPALNNAAQGAAATAGAVTSGSAANGFFS